jgi:hypothetical protein
VVRFRQNRGMAVVRSFSRLFGGSIALSLTLSAQWRGSLWWALMTPFPARSTSRDKGRAREEKSISGEGDDAASPDWLQAFLCYMTP